MKPLLTGLVLLLAAGRLSAIDDAPAKDSVWTAVQALNDAFAKRDAAAIKRLTTDDHSAITPYYGGLATMEEQLKTLAELKITEYKPGQAAIKLIAKDVALVTYPLTQKGTFKGQDLAEKNYVSAVWVQRNGKWMEATYQETALAK